jgi:hypothetical protein
MQTSWWNMSSRMAAAIRKELQSHHISTFVNGTKALTHLVPDH